MARDQQVRRQWWLWVLLCSGPRARSASELARLLGPEPITARTVRRDLELLRRIGVPVAVVREGRSTRYSTLDDGPDFRLDADTLLALRLALGLLQPYEGTPIGESFMQLARRLEAHLSPQLLAHFAPLSEGLSVRSASAPSYAACEPVFSIVRRALQERRCLTLDYRSRGGARALRRVHPQGLLHGPRGLYLLALDDERGGALRTFRLERIHSAVLEGAPALRDPEFDADRYLAGSLGVHSPEHPPRRFRVRIHDDVAVRDLQECPWHHTQVLVQEPVATWILELTLESTRELVPKILTLGKSVEVLEPSSLRVEVACALREAAARYGPVAASGEKGRSRSRSVRGRL